MANEIERKFLVINNEYKTMASGVLYMQGYLSTNPHATVRVRLAGKQGFITVKGKDNGISRAEFEYEIPLEDAQQMLSQLCENSIIEKYRYTIAYEGFIWEVDEFLGENVGLIVAEIELKSENEAFEKPDFIGEEVSMDYRYRNSNLTRHPFSSWQK